MYMYIYRRVTDFHTYMYVCTLKYITESYDTVIIGAKTCMLVV